MKIRGKTQLAIYFDTAAGFNKGPNSFVIIIAVIIIACVGYIIALLNMYKSIE